MSWTMRQGGARLAPVSWRFYVTTADLPASSPMAQFEGIGILRLRHRIEARYRGRLTAAAGVSGQRTNFIQFHAVLQQEFPVMHVAGMCDGIGTRSQGIGQDAHAP